MHCNNNNNKIYLKNPTSDKITHMLFLKILQYNIKITAQLLLKSI